MATLGLDTSAYERGIEQARKETQSAANSLNRSANTAGSGVAGMASQFAAASAKANILAGMLASLGTKAAGLAKNLVETGVSYNAQIEKYTTGFTNMLGSAQAAQKAMQAIQEDAARTPFDVASLTQANQLLISAGENAGRSRKVIMALGDAVSATGGGNDELSRMAANLQQIANVGKASAVDIKQFAFAGINIYQVLADYTGKTVEEVQNMTVSYDLLSSALIAASEEGGRYYNAMDTQSQTMNGRISTLKDNVSQLAGLMTGDLSSGIGVVIGNLNDMVVAAQEAYKQDGWLGLAGAITGLSGPIDSAKQKFNELGSAAITALDKASYWLNHDVLKKDAYSDYDSYEEYRDAQDHQSNRDRRRQEALAGKGIYNKSWTERQAEEKEGSGITSGGDGDGDGGTDKNKNKTVTKTVLSALTDAATSYSSNEYGQITKSVTELTEHIKDSTGKVYDQLTRTTTESGKELVNGVVKNYKLVTKEVTDENGKVTTTTQKTYEDASKSLVSTLTQTAQTLKNGISTTIESVTKKYQDNSEHIEQTATETGTRIVNGALETYTKVKTLMDGVETDSKETSQAVVSQYDTLTSNYGAAAERVAQLQAAYNESAASTGEFSEQTLKIGYLLTEEEEKLDAASKALKEYQKNNNRANAQANKFKNIISESNAAFSDFGSSLTSLGEFFDSEVLQNAGDFFTTITNGVSQALNFAASVETLVTTLQTLKTAIEAVNATGGISSVVSGIGKLIGAGGATVAAGTAGAATAGTGVAALGLSIPQIGLIVAGVLAVGAVGYGIYKWATKDKDQTEKKASSSSKLSYKDIQDAYWYGNERAFAGYDYRTDPYTFRQQPSMSDYQNKMQAELARIGEFVEKYLPETGKGVVALDGEEVARIITPSVNANLGQLAVLSGRGN
uniref:Tail tape measure protein n=1 Tax=Siphoviridae sp. ctNHj22 TaxID=2825468 RepID=A0A8S5VFS2_9CAUD|nr:MAG TPA: tail tape measure protein [Siphoviridae sp. ctNHj22]